MNLGTAYLRLGDAPQALEAFRYERRLAPLSLRAYSGLASAYLAQNRTEEAVTALLESSLIGSSPATMARVAKLYRGIDGGNCATTLQVGELSLNHDCPIVRRNLCNAYRDLEGALRGAKLGEFADGVRDRAAHEAVCQ
jgi:tetratricopeptide (TPR) repeat protein